MYCPKCGNEIKNESSFCPKCGAQIHNRIQKPARQKISSGKAPKINTAAFLVILQKYKVLLACGAALVFVLFFITRIWDPTIPPLDAEAVMSVYLTEQVSYSKNKELYRECFTYETENLIDLTVEQLEPIFDRMGAPLKNNGTDSRINDVKDGITEYFSQKPENQKKLVQAITQYSEFHMVNENRKGKKVKANMNVNYLDLSAVNRNILEDSISFAGIGSLFLEGVNLGTLADAAMGDMSFILDKFVEQASLTDERNSCTGAVEFIYDKKERCWKVDHMDKQLMRAYFGIR